MGIARIRHLKGDACFFPRINYTSPTMYIRFLSFRGCVHCLKLSPNLRKQTREVKAALVDKDEKKALMFEVKKLESILAMVREPDENEEDKEEDAQ